MILLGQLFRRKTVELGHFFGQNRRRFETLGEQTDLCNQGVVWNHHGNRPKQSFEIVGQFGAPSITGIHGDEDSESSASRRNGATHEIKTELVRMDGLLNGENLLSDH